MKLINSLDNDKSTLWKKTFINTHNSGRLKILSADVMNIRNIVNRY